MSATEKNGSYAPVAKIEPMELEGSEDGKVGLKASMGLVSGCNVIVGCIIGSGIFIAPGGVLSMVGSINMALMVWIASGLFRENLLWFLTHILWQPKFVNFSETELWNLPILKMMFGQNLI